MLKIIVLAFPLAVIFRANLIEITFKRNNSIRNIKYEIYSFLQILLYFNIMLSIPYFLGFTRHNIILSDFIVIMYGLSFIYLPVLYAEISDNVSKYRKN